MKPGADTSRLGRWRLPAQKHLIVTPELPVTQSASVQRDANAQSVLFLSRPQIKAASPRRRRWRDPERRSGLTAGLVKTPLGLSKQQQSEDRRVPERVTQLCTHTFAFLSLWGRSLAWCAPKTSFFFPIMILLHIRVFFHLHCWIKRSKVRIHPGQVSSQDTHTHT